ncbi:MAG: metallophosphoesterase [Armatimonadetes bacterium]|nr:metallophosphoesterase [Armatimonadota bacterium]MBS1710672.1 metallophosphoesterase [Armatimonadota bacterium]MBX3108343.1 metallophosphoesterase [Fimbriimonadaceae bacterium]
MGLTILHTNDLHGKLTAGRLDFLKQLRPAADLFFDCGDCIKSGNLAIPLGPDPVWPMLADAGITASVPGNRESHVLESVVRVKTGGAVHPILCSNWFRNDGSPVFQGPTLLDAGGFRIGVFGVMVPMVTESMATRRASQFVWGSPIPAAVEAAKQLRPDCDLLVALTHIGYGQDQKLLAAAPQIDLVLGGHSHTVLEGPGNIRQTGSHGRFIGRYVWDGGLVSAELIPWGGA